MVLNIIGLLIGIAILVAGIYYMVQDKDDTESKKIYQITAAVGAIIVIVVLLRMFVFQRICKVQKQLGNVFSVAFELY